MKIIALPDLHGMMPRHLQGFGAVISQADLVLLPGDITNNGNRDNIIQVITTISNYCKTLLAVPGNWGFDPIITYLNELNINLHATHKVIDNIIFIGAGGCLPWVGGNQYSEDDYRKILAEAIEDIPTNMPHILVSHQPPVNTLNDRTSRGKHVGSYAIREFIEKHQPLLCFTGHIHEGQGIDTIGATKIVNAGASYKGAYAWAEIVNGKITALDIYKI